MTTNISLLLGLFLLLLQIVVEGSGSGRLLLTVAYCPSDFSGAGAIVEVEVPSGKWNVVGRFDWPSEIDNNGCPVLYDPIVATRRDASAHSSQYLMFDSTLDQVLVQLDLAAASVAATYKHSDMFFVGFENMAVTADGSAALGLSGTVTQSGLCSDGCYQFGRMDLPSAHYQAQPDVLFKGVTDDAHFLDAAKGVYYVQMDHDLRSPPCAPNPADSCMCAFDAATGALRSSVYTNWTVYGYSDVRRPDGSVLAWLYGFEGRCKDPYNDYLFASLDASLTHATPLGCIRHNATIAEDAWIEGFSLDHRWMATASGDAESGALQLLVFDVLSGSTVLETNLNGLPEALHSAENMVMIWGVNFV